ncbi:MAG: class I mannose-6-phosphate isomerase [Prevotellaceae bacterium]|jgi:mannose-6-phosphate isomerase|nr:class I mannose-6-phosphate isomerase [Prevotellaceae bacterium]
MLYPLKFQPIFKSRIWGGTKLHTQLGKAVPKGETIGESWELSALAGNESVVANGTLAGKTINELMDIYKSELLGKQVFKRFEGKFPLLFKFIDAADNLSIQVHPNDEIAETKHNSSGKTEMWYIIDAEPEAKLYLGFTERISSEYCADLVKNAALEQKLQEYKVKAGDAFFIPAGLVHALGKGILLAEIQQSSDITYRLYDYNRRDSQGNFRELNVTDALDAIDFENNFSPKINIKGEALLCSNYFNVNKLSFLGEITRDYSDLDSFVVLMCVNGKVEIGDLKIAKGETMLIPAILANITLKAKKKTEILEVWVDKNIPK